MVLETLWMSPQTGSPWRCLIRLRSWRRRWRCWRPCRCCHKLEDLRDVGFPCGAEDVGGVQGTGEVGDDVGDLVDAGSNTGGLEELAEASRFLGALESADKRTVGHLGTLEQVNHHHTSH